ncbi:Bro-N domain-containing protein [Cereibacter sphaeroides]|uniref:BRO-N domain-containing protein n=1 Tax=Cereibacter sphaeroides TaxID=1063 RepID=UPI001F208E4B|nr:BRO family protein [Cereibacter sphaeroides]
MLEGNPWFVLKDIGQALGLRPHVNGGYSQHTTRFSADEKRNLIKPFNNPHQSDLWGSEKAQSSVMSLISESGFNKLVMRSDKPEARKFQDWVTREVLPSIRKTGTYTMPGMSLNLIAGDTKTPRMSLGLIEGDAKTPTIQTCGGPRGETNPR